MGRIVTSLFLAVALLLVNTFACAGESEPLEQVKLRLVWKHQFQFAGYYIAKVKGYYADAGLDVEIQEVDRSSNHVESVLSGEVDFGIGRSSILVNRSRGNDIVALFPAFQRSPLMLLARKDSGIRSPKDLKGRRVMITPDSRRVGSLVAMLLQAGVKQEDLVRQKHSFNIMDLINGKTDAMASYVSNEPFQMESKGVPYTILHPSDYGFDFYSDILFTTGKMVRDKPELTERFFEASMRGWEYAFENIEETAAIVHSFFNSQNRSLEALEFEGHALKQLAFDEDGVFGTLKQRRFDEMAQIYLIAGAIDKGYSLDGFVYKPPTNQLRLSYNESRIVKRNQPVRVCTDPEWMPYAGLVGNRHQGVVADYMELLAAKTGVNLQIVATGSWVETLAYMRQGKCDMLSLIIQTPSRDKYLDFSSVYLSMPIVVASRDKEPDFSPFTRVLGVPRGFAYKEIFQQRYPAARLVDVESPLEGLRLVTEGKIWGLLGTSAHLRYVMQQNRIGGLHINQTVGDMADIRIGVAKGETSLLTLLNKGIESITPEEHSQILNHWIATPSPNAYDPRVIWSIFAAIGLLGLIGLYRYSLTLYRNRVLESIAEHDQLTGISSRHKLINKLEEHLQIANRYQRPLSLIYFDIDDFKQINDTFGHAVGDRVLIELTALIRAQTRKTDLFGRWGGEEFLFVMPETGLRGGKSIAEKLRSEISRHDFQLGASVTCSFGVVEYTHDESLEEFVKRADDGLYRAKDAGKNRVSS